LHRRGFAHSVEAWQTGRLAGGLYGLSIRGTFFGESMFSLVPNASKAALAHLVGHLRSRRFVLLDVQFLTRHLAMLGAIEVSRSTYMKLLVKGLSSRSSF
jgi:leucyl/phenylalanyl-tRNA--protein transferase